MASTGRAVSELQAAAPDRVKTGKKTSANTRTNLAALPVAA